MSKTVLIIEDNQGTVDLLTDIVEMAGHRAIAAHNGQVGIEKAQHQKPDLILLDIMMPQVSGYEVCERLKKNLDTTAIPIIIISVRSRREDIQKGLSLGASDYITKPFDLTHVETIVKKYLG